LGCEELRRRPAVGSVAAWHPGSTLLEATKLYCAE
jgi:hypothetical protein